MLILLRPIGLCGLKVMSISAVVSLDILLSILSVLYFLYMQAYCMFYACIGSLNKYKMWLHTFDWLVASVISPTLGLLAFSWIGYLLNTVARHNFSNGSSKP